MNSVPEERASRPLPAGTLTMLLTDIEGSTRLWRERPDAMRVAWERHHAIVRDTIARRGGYLPPDQGEGDSVFAVFARASDAVASALEVQRALVAERWPEGGELRVRVVLHTGELDLRDDGRNYFGEAISHCARLRAIGHGGQVLLSQATESVVGAALPKGAALQDLGLHRLKDLSATARVFQLAHPDLPADFPPLRSLDVVAHNLPAQVTSFIGREREMIDVKRLLGQSRLVTLVGPGGTGKTRLASQVAADVLDDYPDGVWLVELASVADTALIAPTIASAVAIREQGDQGLLATLTLAFQSRRVLLILDNCEHLIDGCAHVAGSLLRTCPSVRILATSREPLGIAGEITWPVPSLATPSPASPLSSEQVLQYEAVRLFVERAVAVSPRFSVSRDNVGAIAQICYRLDGIPLALELAAVRVKLLSVQEIATRLDDRFRLLAGSSRTDRPRHQTLRSLIDWSYELLSDTERRFFTRLSVFAGSFGLDAVEAVCGGDGIDVDDVLTLLAQLVDKSLVLVEAASDAGRETRYRLLETLQQYAAEKLRESGESWVLRRRHAAWCLDLAERAESEVGQPDAAIWANRLRTEHDNVRAALERTKLDDSPEVTLRLAGAVWWFWETQGHWTEGRRHLEAALAATAADAPPTLRLKVLHGAATLADSQGDQERATALLEEAVSLHRGLGDRLGVAFTLNRLGQIAIRRSNFDRATRLLEESLAMFREVGDPVLIADALDTLGNLAYQRGDTERAQTLLEESLGLFRRLGDKRGTAAALRGLAHFAREHREFARAGALAQESAELFQQVGDSYGFGSALYIQAHAAAEQGDYQRAEMLLEAGIAEERRTGDVDAFADKLRDLATVVQYRKDYHRALSLLKESVALHQQLGHAARTVTCVESVACVLADAGQFERAARLFAAADALRRGVGSTRMRTIPVDSERLLALTRSRLGEDKFAAAWDAGRTLSLEQAVAEARAVEIVSTEEG